MKNLYPFESKFLDLNGIKLHYVDEGGGEPVVMLHGNPTWSFYFRELISDLRKDYRVIAPDHIGMGYSDKPDDTKYEYTLRHRVNDLESLLDHLNIKENITLVLHDWGGMIGMAFAVRHPRRIKRFVIMNTSAFHLPETKPFPWQLQLTRTPPGDFLVRDLNAFSLGAAAFCVTRKPLSPDVREGYLAPYDSRENRISVLRFVQDIPLEPGDPAYKIVTEVEKSLEQFTGHPMLILWGMKDFVFDRHFLEKWTEAFPNAQTHRFEDAGHYVLEDARDEIVELVREFLKQNPGKKR